MARSDSSGNRDRAAAPPLTDVPAGPSTVAARHASPLGPVRTPVGELPAYPPADQWDRWTELDAKAWPRRVPHTYTLVPTTCFNCESACGLLGYVDVETLRIRKFEGNPAHPGSRGRTCAKGPATLNQVEDPDRILYPLKRAGQRGDGQWERTTWDEVLETFAARIRKALVEGRKTEIMYHVGRPGEDGYMERVLQSWGVDAHNSHTNICSSGGRFGYAAWMGADRPSPDYTNARFTLLISSHLETGHYFNPHAQRIMEAKKRGAKLAVMDPRLSNTASMADYWLPTYPGSEAAVLLAMANVLIQERLYDREFVRRWTNWDQYMRDEHPAEEQSFEAFERILAGLYAEYIPELAEKESGVPAERIVAVAREIGRAGSAFSAHNWRAAAAGNLGGWTVARCLFFLNVLTGSVGTLGGTAPNIYDKFVPRPFAEPGKQQVWNSVSWPLEYPLAHHEMSFLLPHFLREGRGKVDVYFTRVYNPVWTNPDGFSWIEMLTDEAQIGLHAAMTPTWNETAWFADYVLPMGNGAERHDLHSYETAAGQWIAFRQPVRRVAMERLGKPVRFTYEANPGEVWEENEWWIELSWRVDPDGSLGIRRFFESPYRPGEKLTVDEYYRWIFEHSVPGLPEAAAAEGLTPLAYMRKYGAFALRSGPHASHEDPVAPEDLAAGVGTVDEAEGTVWSARPRPKGANAVPRPAPATGERGTQVGVVVDGAALAGFPTPSGKLELYSTTLRDWGWPEYALPAYIKSHIAADTMDYDAGDFALLPTFRLPVLVHTRSNNAKWLTEIAHSNPLWMHPSDAARLGLVSGQLVRVSTAIGHFVPRLWTTEGIRPGVVACSHHMGRWTLEQHAQHGGWSTARARLERQGQSRWLLRQTQGVTPYTSADADTARIWWTDAGVHQNLTFPVHPDPISGSHCWHQKVRVTPAEPEDRYGDIAVDTEKAHEVYREWLALARPAPGPSGMRRPHWMLRPYRPDPAAYQAPVRGTADEKAAEQE